jgi:short-subunit dehydrogenase
MRIPALLTSRKPFFLAGAALAGAATGAVVVGAATTVTAAVMIARALRTRPVPDNAVVLITGGSRGMGLAIASRFARKPVRLVLVARSRADLDRAQAELLSQHPHLAPENFYLVAADLAVRAECERVVRETIHHFGRIDVLVNNAGIMEVGPIEAQTAEAFERAMRLNFFAALYTTWAALPHLRTQTPLAGWDRRAALVNICSIGGKVAAPHMLPYTASKFALVGFSEGLHAELRHKGIHVATVCPGLTRTGGEAHAQFVGDAEAERKWFTRAANMPFVSASARYAAGRIYTAIAAGRTEVIITPQAWIIARKAALMPETMQLAASLANQYILPKPPGAETRSAHLDPLIPGESQED